MKTRSKSNKMPAGETDYITYAYAGAITAGGLIGFFTKGSVPSLAAGLSCGALLALGGFQMSSDPKNVGLTLAVAGALAGVMGFRTFKTGKFMPAGLVAAMRYIDYLYIALLLMVLRLLHRMYNKSQ
ncbi:hypothetical protein KUTeg_017129 [Tegillarca granosa]|uniref:Transmembrane protein 14C n=1 Tax=Tegillarca granosa TaxID=220873 RepID=A0ABQ9ENR1_TEGGR|nr:hypothetical protein KUTeg_017129 [Tegillarca granosa]